MGKEKHKIQIDISKNTCRVCLSNNATNNIYCGKIFYNKMKVYCYEMMDDMLSMPAYSGDGLPCMICKKCLSILTAAYKLKLLAKESNRQLLLSLSNHSLQDKEKENTISSHSLKNKEVKTVSSNSLKSKEEVKTVSSHSLKSKEVNTISSHSLKSKEDVKTLSSHSLKSKEEVKTVSNHSLKSKEVKKISSHSLKSKEEVKTVSSHSLRGKEEAKIKEETPQVYTVLIENEIKKEETNEWMQLDDDYIEHDAGAKEETDALGDGVSFPPDIKPYCNDDATRWSESAAAPAKEEEAPSGALSDIPAPSQDVVKSTDKPLSAAMGNKVKRKYSLKAKKKPYNSRLSSSLLCEECGVTFSCKNVAEHHRKLVHLKEKRFFCDYCNKGYLDRPRLVLHIKMHEGRKTYKCPNCGKMYYSRGGLSAHMVTERGVRNHSCALCPKKFWSRMGLVNHSITHTRERAFPCRYCPSAFSRKKNRKRHEVQMHQATPTEEEMRFQKTQILVNKSI